VQEQKGSTTPWVAIRIGTLVVAFLCAGRFIRSLPGDFSQPSWLFLAVMIAVVAVGVALLLGFQKVNPLSSASWKRPRWTDNPFAWREPLKYMHFSAMLFIALGLGCVLLGFLKSPHSWAWELPIGIGVGAWIGVRVSCDPEGHGRANDT
jgi:hypothetical protein